jgi:hypothetical protein
MNLASFSLLLTIMGIGAFAIVAAPAIEPNHEGLAACQKLHPVRYCRIANGFPVERLDSQAK